MKRNEAPTGKAKKLVRENAKFGYEGAATFQVLRNSENSDCINSLFIIRRYETSLSQKKFTEFSPKQITDF